ncbi:MAG: P-loop NTPase [Gemmatimonadales bacterium]
MSFRTYFEVAGADRSRLEHELLAQRDRVATRLNTVERVVAVMSGKGGVGKSHVCAALAGGAARLVQQGVGVVDADLRSPTVSRMLDARGPLIVTDDGVSPAVAIERIRVVSMDLLIEDRQPLSWREPDGDSYLWRGAQEAGALREFLGDVAWGSLDVLLIDLPPGADGAMDLAALYPNIAGAVAVTIPSEESGRSVARTIRASLAGGVTLLGVVENMSGCTCAACGSHGPLFAGSAGDELAEEFGVPLLGKIPFRTAKTASRFTGPEEKALVERFLEVLA